MIPGVVVKTAPLYPKAHNGGKMKLFLDDVRVPHNDDWIVVRTAEECIEILSRGGVESLSLDHDLGTKATGYDVLKWIERKVFTEDGYIRPFITIHTANPPARDRMISSLKRIIRREEEGR